MDFLPIPHPWSGSFVGFSFSHCFFLGYLKISFPIYLRQIS
jgi:hypothetical protein